MIITIPIQARPAQNGRHQKYEAQQDPNYPLSHRSIVVAEKQSSKITNAAYHSATLKQKEPAPLSRPFTKLNNLRLRNLPLRPCLC